MSAVNYNDPRWQGFPAGRLPQWDHAPSTDAEREACSIAQFAHAEAPDLLKPYMACARLLTDLRRKVTAKPVEVLPSGVKKYSGRVTVCEPDPRAAEPANTLMDALYILMRERWLAYEAERVVAPTTGGEFFSSIHD